MNYYKWIDNNFSQLVEKKVAVSGATGGIGTVLCDYLAYLGAEIICLDRNSEKSNNLISLLNKKYPTLKARHIKLDLEDIDNVKSATQELIDEEIDFLVLNAGAYKIPRYKCSTGYDNVFQINFVSPYYMACMLMPYIKNKGGRVVAVSSIAHNYSKIDMNDLDFTTRKASSKVYGNAKRFLTYSLLKFFNGDESLSIVHPGITFTNITNHYPKLIFAIIKHPMKVIFMPVKKAALCVLQGLFEGCFQNEWIGPKFFYVWGLPVKKRLNTATKKEIDEIYINSINILNNLNNYEAD